MDLVFEHKIRCLFHEQPNEALTIAGNYVIDRLTTCISEKIHQFIISCCNPSSITATCYITLHSKSACKIDFQPYPLCVSFPPYINIFVSNWMSLHPMWQICLFFLSLKFIGAQFGDSRVCSIHFRLIWWIKREMEYRQLNCIFAHLFGPKRRSPSLTHRDKWEMKTKKNLFAPL